MLLRDLILKKLASKIPYKDEEELKFKLNKYSSKIDEITGSLSLNWFLSLFHNAVPWQVSGSFLSFDFSPWKLDNIQWIYWTLSSMNLSGEVHIVNQSK